MTFGTKIDKILIATNPLTWCCIVISVIFCFFELLNEELRISSIFFLWYKIPRLTKDELEKVLKHSKNTISSDTTKYNKWIHRQAIKKINKLL